MFFAVFLLQEHMLLMIFHHARHLFQITMIIKLLLSTTLIMGIR